MSTEDNRFRYPRQSDTPTCQLLISVILPGVSVAIFTVAWRNSMWPAAQ